LDLYGKELAHALFEAVHADPKELAKAKLNAALQEFAGRFGEYVAGRGSQVNVLASALRWLESERALSNKPADQVAAYERHWAVTKVIELICSSRHEAGRIWIGDYLQAKYFRLQAEIWLAQARADGAKAGTPR